MIEFLAEYGLFLAKTVTVVVAILIIMAAAVANAMKSRKELEKGDLRVTHLNKDIDELRKHIRKEVLDKQVLKLEGKRRNKEEKQQAKARRKASKAGGPEERKRVYVIDFEGDTKASQVEDLRKVVTAVLSMARPERDEILLRLESPGGMVHGYGLAASQLNRIRQQRVSLTICVDKVAASGGYLMACLGNRIIAAPFAYVGSIGVLMQLPNFHRLLQDNKVDYEMITAGEYKRTLTIFGENTDKDREKVREDIQDVHDQFKNFIRQHRPSLPVDEVATGEVWLGQRALDKGLVDEISTSDEHIVAACEGADVYSVRYEHKKKIGEKLHLATRQAMESAFGDWLQKADKNRYYS